MNSVTLYGRVGQDPDIRNTSNGTLVANLSVATSDRVRDASGNYVEYTDWHTVVFFGKFAELIAKRLKKGDSILVRGKNKTESYTDKQGVKRYVTKVHGENFEF